MYGYGFSLDVLLGCGAVHHRISSAPGLMLKRSLDVFHDQVLVIFHHQLPHMADPLSIIGLALTVIQILRPAVQQLKDAYSKGGSVHQSLDELRADSEAVCDLIDNIHRVLKAPNFIAAVEEVQGESQVDLLECLQRALRSCEREAQRLSNLLYDLDISGATGRLRQGMLQLKLDRRSDDLQHIKRNFQDHKSSIQLAFQVVTTYVDPF
jgi:hypothetical protein